MAACLFLPHHREQVEFLRLPDVLILLIVGGPFPVVSAGACALTVFLLVRAPHRALGAAGWWLASWVLGLGFFWWLGERASDGGTGAASFPWYFWGASLLAGLWTCDLARGAPPPPDPRTDVKAFD